MNQSEIERERRRSRPIFEVIGDDHPDQPRFDGGVIGVVIAAALLWAIAGALIWWALA